MDLTTALIAACTALAGALALLWKRVDSYMRECTEERAKCEEELRRVWARIDTFWGKDKTKEGS